MKTSSQYLIILAIVVAVLTSDICFGSSDFQWWNSANAVLDLNKNWGFTFEEQLRMGEDAGTLVRYHSDLGIVYHGLADWLDLGINYRSIENKANDGDWDHRDRMHANFTLHGKLLGRDVSNRLRFDYDMGQQLKDFSIFRNKITINPPFEYHHHQEIFESYIIKPFLSYELFYDNLSHKISKHRYSVGLSIKLSEKWFSKLYYMRQEDSSIFDINLNVVGLQIRFLF